MKKRILSNLLLILVLASTTRLQSAFASPASHPTHDYSYQWWADGWRGRSPEGRKVVNIQTNTYGLSLDVEKVSLLRLGNIDDPRDYAGAASEGNERIDSLPRPEFSLAVHCGTTEYVCVGADPNAIPHAETAAWEGDKPPQQGSSTDGFPMRLIDSGRFVQRVDLMHLIFEDGAGNRLPALGRLELYAWPDCLSFQVELTAQTALEDVELAIRLNENQSKISSGAPSQDLNPGQQVGAALAWGPKGKVPEPPSPLIVSVTDTHGGHSAVEAEFEAARVCHRIPLKSRGDNPGENPDHLDRFQLSLVNPSEEEQVARLFFDFDGNDAPPITGFSPILLDAQGEPAGIPVQISKNWHTRPGMTFLYQGPWFHGYTFLRLAPGETWEGELVIATARWGGVPAASHSQLSLVGWGTNQRWDQVAIGSWGESICYDPDVNLNRSMIDDVRPLMVWGMRNQEQSKWTWTNNVGGGDFLVYYDAQGKKQFLSRVKAAYLHYCPNLTQALYSGVTADGHIAASITVSSPGCDDLNRSFHRIRYDVLERTPFTRLAFYQVGSDGYNDQQFNTLARGNSEGLVEEWTFEQGGLKYDRQGVLCDGTGPWWFSLHDAIPHGNNGSDARGAWANRGLVVRSWKARLGGREAPFPFASFYGTENGKIPGMNVELSPPVEVRELLPGDYLEAEVEWVVVPMAAEDYYGPNENLRAALTEGANTWKVIHREAVGNDLRIECAQGSLERAYPIEVALDENGTAEFTVMGGVGYVPLSLTGLPSPSGYTLIQTADPAEANPRRSVPEKDFWQTDFDPARGTWTRTYNLNLDTPGDEPRKVRFRFGPSE